MTSPDYVAQASALCLACRMCCDGTLFPGVVLHPGEEERLRALGLEARFGENGGQYTMRQPCPADSAGGCTIYASKPVECGRYNCATLQALDRGEIDSLEARRRIDEILAQRTELVRHCGTANLYEARLQIREREAHCRNHGQPLPTALFDLVILERLIDLYLRPAADAVTMGGPAHG